MVELISVILGIAVGFAVAFFTVQELIVRPFRKRLIGLLDETILRPSRTSSVAERKKGIIQKMGPKTFYYLDESQVKDLYPQVLQGLEPKRIETRERKSVIKGIAGKLKFFEPKYETGKVIQQTKTYEVQQKLPMMYNKVEQYLIGQGKIIFGMEEFEYHKSLIDDFTSMCSQMQTKFNFPIPDDLQNKFVSDKMRDLALESKKKLHDSSGYIAFQAEFLVKQINNIYVLLFDHPLNTHLSENDTPVKIQISCAKKYMTPSGLSTFREDRPVKTICLGKVVSWDDINSTLEISPIAMY